MGIRIENVSKQFRNFAALDNVSLHVKTGELVALLGPSGCGKTTLLRVISGLEFADSGEIYIEQAGDAPAGDRRVGFVFQHYALFRHMTVFDNIAFGLRMKKGKDRKSDSEIDTKVSKLLDLIHLTDRQNRYPSQLSGGQRQRVALARALAVDPSVLLLDEPFGALDAKVRKELRRWLRKIHDELSITIIFVTHDQEEAMDVADRVVVMNGGCIEQVGTPAEIYDHPANAFVYDFLGNYNAFDGWQGDKDKIHLLRKGEQAPADGKPVRLFVRPHDMDVAHKPQDTEAISARVVQINPAGALVSIDMEDDNGAFLQAAVPREKYANLNLKKGETVFLKPRAMKVF
ncbi:MAG: sulfate/molybdate ABC transporter ATP-binding protein [Alphaproteobacteria bacterium]